MGHSGSVGTPSLVMVWARGRAAMGGDAFLRVEKRSGTFEWVECEVSFVLNCGSVWPPFQEHLDRNCPKKKQLHLF